MSRPFLKVTADFTEQFNQVIKRFKNDAVLIGIPEEETDRKPDKKGEKPKINNATLLAINNFGSPKNNIPARPVMEIGIKNAQDEVIAEFKKAAISALSRGVEFLPVAYNRIGILASNSVKKAINAQEGIEELSEKTLAARKARGFKGEKALIVTGQTRNAITYVVKGDK